MVFFNTSAYVIAQQGAQHRSLRSLGRRKAPPVSTALCSITKKMGFWKKLRYVAAIIAQIVSGLFLIMSGVFLANYYMDFENHLRHEYMIGVWVGIMYAVGFSIGSALLASTVKQEISKISFKVLTIPALVIGLGFLLLYFVTIAYDVASRT